MTFVVGKISSSGAAAIDGTQYDRTAVAAYVPPRVDTVFIQVGRTPFAIAAGGYYAPPEDEE